MLSILLSALLGSAAVHAVPTVDRREDIPCNAANIEDYAVVKDDTLGKLADRYKSGICDIAKYNNLPDPNHIEVNQHLKIPANCKSPPDDTTCLSPPKPKPAPVVVVPVDCPDEAICKATQMVYTSVVEGDTLGAFAYLYGTGICDIAKASNIQNPNLIFPKQNLTIPAHCTGHIDNTTCIPPDPPVTKDATCIPSIPLPYNVVSGDTLTKIAGEFSISLQALEGSNPQITNPDKIDVGQLITVPAADTYSVVSGDTFSAIATRFGLSLDAFTKANPQVPDINKIDVGQALKLPLCNSGSASVAQCPSEVYKIKSGDLFVDLANTYKTTIARIQSFNPALDPTKLAVDAPIRLPKNCA
ncbi:Carbohydrate-binding module family 50 protein [Teratosphaeria destructans]|uniref:Carbohydrate-binding module family 50 protein n=1 Tax=Teratosphaeria destructans TaxID=418781 RepID=A0A9W7SL30_9PEZI|nr:Carbohydrate-binding module family 50 protein [Teratosphaeria destructans]